MKKILVIDDSKTIRTMCEMIHKGLEDKVLTAASVAEAELIINSQKPEVILVDYTLPDGNVYDFIKTHVGPGRGIVMLGGTYADCDPDAAIAAGAVSVIIKPFKTDEFFAAVDAAYAVSQGAAAPAPAVSAPAPSASAPAVPPAMPPAPPISSTGNAAVPPAPPKRFNFPGQAAAATTNSGIVSSPAQPAVEHSAVSKTPDQATPKTPVPSISPEVIAARADAAAADNDLIKAEVMSAVKQLLPPLVSNYLKKLIQQEVKPQLQTWVDARVEAVVRKIMQQ